MMITNDNAIAAEKLQKNVAEFIIYMYQMEDLCRVYEFNLSDLETYVIKHFPVNDDQKADLSRWFAQLIEEIKAQKIEARGHLKEVQKFVDQLIELKYRLLEKDEEFAEIYKQARPHIREVISESNGTIPNDIQACLNGVYGLLLARMNGKEVPEELNPALNAFGNVLSYLSYKYKQEDFLNSN